MQSRPPVRRPLAFRIAAVAAIAALHALALLALSSVRARRADAPDAAPVEVAFLPDAAVPAPPPPGVRLEDVHVPVMTLPLIDIPVEVAPAAPVAPITVVAATAPTPPAVPGPGSDAPVSVETVEYARPCTLRYPPMARRMNAQGTTLVRVLVDTEGRPQEVRVDRSSGFKLLDDAAVECAHQALFKPRREGGRLRHSLVTIPFDFFTTVRTASR